MPTFRHVFATSPSPRSALTTPVSALLCVFAFAACEVIPKGDTATKQDTTTAPATGMPGDMAAGGALTPGDSAAGVPAVPPDSATQVATQGGDTGVVRIEPAVPRRGGVIFALVEGAAATRCTWKGAALPCYPHAGGTLALIPLPADEPAGRFTLTVERPGGRIAREITVNENEFGRELIFLDKEHYALIGRTADVARDARAVRSVLAGESANRQWDGAWRPIVSGPRGSGYGVERFYYPASDSARAIQIPSGARARGGFGGDTVSAPFDRGSTPGWRHAGVDMSARRGTPVTAPANGTVADVGDYTLTGRTVVLDHGQGVFTAYFHLDSALVRDGDQVRAGRSIGRVGSSGLSTGAHLHYGVYIHGRDVDPAAWREMPAWVRGGTAAAASAGRAQKGKQ